MARWAFRTVLVKRGFAGWKWIRSWRGGPADESRLFATFYECVEDARGEGYPGTSTLADFTWETTGGYITATPDKQRREPGIIPSGESAVSHADERDLAGRVKRQAA
jgi:hypothetical protein